MINLTFPNLHEDIQVDKYRIFSIEKLQNNYVIFAAYYAEEGDIDDNIGKTLLIWIGQDIRSDTKLDALKAQQKVKTFFWDVDHQNDEKIPSFSTQWLTNKKCPENLVGLSMMNHAE